MVDTAVPVMVFVAIVLSLVPHGHAVWTAGGADRRGLCAAPALQRRFAGVSTGIGHRRRPSAADRDRLFASFHSGYAISIYIAACAVVSLVATAMMPDHTGKDISMEYDD